jgi:hypothetical protein
VREKLKESQKAVGTPYKSMEESEHSTPLEKLKETAEVREVSEANLPRKHHLF